MAGTRTSMLVCGSLITTQSAASLGLLRSTLLHDASFARLRQELAELPHLWALLADREPAFHSLDAAPLFQSLSAWLASGSNASDALRRPEGAPSNIYHAVLTVLTHIAEYTAFMYSNANTSEGDLHSQRLQDLQDGGIQGLCYGLLSAMALSCSDSRVELAHNAAVAVRLAVCAAACVDLDELRSSEPTVCLSARWGRNEGSEVDDSSIAALIDEFAPVRDPTHLLGDPARPRALHNTDVKTGTDRRISAFAPMLAAPP